MNTKLVDKYPKIKPANIGPITLPKNIQDWFIPVILPKCSPDEFIFNTPTTVGEIDAINRPCTNRVMYKKLMLFIK